MSEKKKSVSFSEVSRAVNAAFQKGEVTLIQIITPLKEKYRPDNQDSDMLYALYPDNCFMNLYRSGYIEPVKVSRRQAKILKQWNEVETDDWDSGEDGHGGEYKILENIKWKALKKRLPRYI